MTVSVDCVVIGAGVVGLAIARALAMAGKEVLILEAEATFGSGVSSRNSEVIHAGIYYPTGSLKARFCVEGNSALYDFCRTHGVDFKRCGKLIVASQSSQVGELSRIEQLAKSNGVLDLQRMTAEDVLQREPALKVEAGLFSPSTGIVDSHGLMLALLGDAERYGAQLVLRTPVIGGALSDKGIHLDVGGSSPMSLHARYVVNAAALGAQAVAHSIQGFPREQIPPLSLAKGNYFALNGASPFRHLVYPVPEAHGLGVHLTLDLAGQARFGPDVAWVDTLDYTVNPELRDKFVQAIRGYWPEVAAARLQPAYAGIRPKPHFAHESSRDFIIAGPDTHGVAGWVNLFGIESPGLTSALPLADYVVSTLLQ